MVLDQLADDKSHEDDNLIDTWKENDLNQRIKNGPWED